MLDFFGGTNYLSLSYHPALVAAVTNLVQAGGLGLGASRKTTGTSPAILALEEQVARFAGKEEAAVTGSGLSANIAVIEALAGEVSAWIVDERAHPTFQNFVPIGGAKLIRYAHGDAADLRRRLGETSGTVGVFTDGVFPLTGEVAPLAEIRKALEGREHYLVIDEAHSFGATGFGACGVALGLGKAIVTVTFSKALSCTGGAVLASSEICARVRDKSASYSGSSALAPALCAGVSTALSLIGEAFPRLQANMREMREGLAGLPLLGSEGVPIFCVSGDSGIDIAKIHARCLEAGCYVPLIDAYPGMGASSLLRWIVQADHSREQIRRVRDVIRSLIP